MAVHNDAIGALDEENGEATKALAEGTPSGGSRLARLDWVDAQSRAASSRSFATRVVIGTSENADVRLRDPMVSRLHAELSVHDDGVWVRDLKSRNGTWVEGLRVEHALAPRRARVRVAQVEMTLTSLDAPGQCAAVGGDLPESRFPRLCGSSAKMQALRALLARVAPSDAPVLIQGETGTGKELVARSIHEGSARAGGPYVVVDCAALPESLLESELFGHAKGAFTGASQERIGAVEAASGGTVFLDEIGELPVSMQPKLLRVLESKTIRRIGETCHRQADVRFVFATHRDLLAMVSRQQFREDLYFRIGVLQVDLPPLRERMDDLDVLLRHFLGHDMTIPDHVLDVLRARSWPGNVRELRNFIDRMRALGPERALTMTGVRAPLSSTTGCESSPFIEIESGTGMRPREAAALPQIDVGGTFREFRERWCEQGERAYVHELLARHGRNVSAAAREADLDRTYLHKLIRKYGV